MKQHVVSVYDRALNAYMSPWCVPALGAAIRAFQDAVNDNTTPMSKHPDDYELHELASWDDHSGKFESLPEPKQLAIAKNLLVQHHQVHGLGEYRMTQTPNQ